ncbi:MAG: peptide-methionine (R)-S-oxide reductase MsrB [Nanoarchaeota archaeon]
MKNIIPRTDNEWEKKLSPEQYRVMREGDTEMPFTGKFLDNKEKGEYSCAACKNSLFSSDTKFNSGTGWPSFTDANKKNIMLKEDYSHGMHRIMVICKKCKSKLGHVFDDIPKELGERYCINSCALKFKNLKK